MEKEIYLELEMENELDPEIQLELELELDLYLELYIKMKLENRVVIFNKRFPQNNTNIILVHDTSSKFC